MLPADLVAGAVEKCVQSPELRRSIQSGIVATLTFPALNATTVVLVFLWLGQLGFSSRERLAGALSLLLGTSFLHYCQIHMENSLQTFLLFADAFFLWRWLKSEQSRWLAVAAATVALAGLIRLPALAEHFGLWLAALWLTGVSASPGANRIRRQRLRQLLLVALPIVLLGLLADRAYHFHRFGAWSGTYLSELAAEWSRRYPELPRTFPFSGSFLLGFFGPFFSPDRSVLLHDPLLWILIAVCILGWAHVPRELWAILAGGAIGFLALAVFYAKYEFWDGAACWGNRFTLAPLQLLLSLAVPLWLKLFGNSHRRPRLMLAAVLTLSVFVQVLSLLLPPSVEKGRHMANGEQGNAIVLRVQSVIALCSGEPPPPGVTADMWRINLAPATLGHGSNTKLILLWLAWLAVAAFSATALKRLWLAASQSSFMKLPPAAAALKCDMPSGSRTLGNDLPLAEEGKMGKN